MHIFKNIKMNKLLKQRYKLKQELIALENDDTHLFEQLVYPGGMSGDRYIKINYVREQIRNVNAQIAELLKD